MKAPELRYLKELGRRWADNKFVCLGLDSATNALPKVVRGSNCQPSEAQMKFNRAIIEATSDEVCAYKINLAFYLENPGGVGVLAESVAEIHTQSPGVPVILDGKFGDVGNSSAAYARFAFDTIDADAVTVNPYVGGDGIAPFTDRSDRGVFVLARTSNPGASELQGLGILDESDPLAKNPLYAAVAKTVNGAWNANNNCGLVVGATAVDELAKIRALVPILPILLPGVGTQGGDLRGSLLNGRNLSGNGLFINVSRALIFASAENDFDVRAREELLKLNRRVEAVVKEDQGHDR